MKIIPNNYKGKKIKRYLMSKKNIKVDKDLWKALKRMKLENDKKTISNVIRELVENEAEI